MILSKPELELLVKTVQPLKRGPVYSRLYVGCDDQGMFLSCLDGSNVVFIGEGEPRVPNFQIGQMWMADLSIKDLLKKAREATKPAKYDVKFELNIAMSGPQLLLNFKFNGGDYVEMATLLVMEELLGMEDLVGLGAQSMTRHEFSATGLVLMTQVAALSKNQPMRLEAGQGAGALWGVCLAASDNGFGGVATVERSDEAAA
jgi:hypothetical protein